MNIEPDKMMMAKKEKTEGDVVDDEVGQTRRRWADKKT